MKYSISKICIVNIVLCCSISVSAANFGPAIDLNSVQSMYAGSPYISLNDSGKGIAVWQEVNGSLSNIYARTYGANTGWFVTATNLNNNQLEYAGSPYISLNDLGTGIAVWLESNGGIANIYARTYDANTGWSVTATNLNNNQSMPADSPYISLNDSGTGIAVWQEYNGGIANIYARTYDANTGWSVTATNLNNNQLEYAYTPYISLNDLGKGIAVWRERNGSVYNVCARTYDANAGWSVTATNLNNNQLEHAYSPYISLNDSGKGIAVWLESNGGIANIYARTYDPSTGWSVTATNLNNNQLEYAYSPSYISLNDSGKGIAVWLESNGGIANIYARTYDANTGWSVTATNLNNNQSMPADSPYISLNDSGTGIAVWQEYNGGIANIYARTYDANTGWSVTATNLNNNQLEYAYTPYISLNDLGKGIAVWRERNGSVYNVCARQLAAPCYYTQWNSAPNGSKQYMSTVYNNSLGQSFIDMYDYDVQTNSKEYKATMTIEGTINHYAVYNKSDAELYSAIITTSPDSLLVWSFNGSTAEQTSDLSSRVTLPLNDAQWWTTSTSQAYITTIGSSELTILDMVNASHDNSISASGKKLLWTTKDNDTGLVVISDTVATPYSVDFSTNPITIAQGTGVTAPTGFEYESISTCGDYIAVGFSSTDTTTYGFARVALLTLDSDTNTLSLSSTVTTLAGQQSVNSLARCCCCAEERPLLVGSYAQTGYPTLRVLSPDLSSQYASTVLGNNVVSVGWSCQGESNTYLTASSLENNGFQYTVKYTFTDSTLTDQIVVTR